MKILLAAPRGFCAGVNMAVKSLDLALKHFGAPVYVFHEIVHIGIIYLKRLNGWPLILNKNSSGNELKVILQV
jgi:4-hydroxy-3-methylbut-2-enyl diphosphate reductase IspH